MESKKVKHINRVKEIYILSAISQYSHTDVDYLCDNADILLKRFNIDKDEYAFLIDKLEKEAVVIYEEKYHEDDHMEFSYDGKKIEQEKLLEILETYKKWLGYEYEIDFHSIPALANIIRKYYKEEDLLIAISSMSEGLYTHLNNNLEEILYYYMSSRNKVLHKINGLEVLAKMFDVKYHDAEYLFNLEKGFFNGVLLFFKEMLSIDSFELWQKNLPQYIQEKIKVEQFVNKNKLYITKDADDFRYKGKLLKLSKKANYYKVFCALYARLPTGGEIEYREIIKEVKSRISSTKSKPYKEMCKFIQRNLTEKNSGFMKYGCISQTEDNGKALISLIHGTSVVFNNGSQ